MSRNEKFVIDINASPKISSKIIFIAINESRRDFFLRRFFKL